MIDPKTVLRRLHDSLNSLQERRAKPGLDAPAGLTREIEAHEMAIRLTEQLAAGRLTETAWREQLQLLLVTLKERQATEAISALNIGGVSFSDIRSLTLTHSTQPTKFPIPHVTYVQLSAANKIC